MRRVLLLAIAAALVGTACGQVNPGERAVFIVWGKMQQVCYKEGFYWYFPISTNMDEIDIKDRKFFVEKLTAVSQDLQDVHADVAVIYGLDGSGCHILLQTVGHDYESRIIAPAVSEVLKASTAHFPIGQIIRERIRLKDEIVLGLRARLEPYKILVRDVALTDFGFSQEFARAVERKQVEEQRVQEKEYVRQQAVKIAEAAIVEARGKAEANKLLAESLRQAPETLRFRELEVLEKKWDGQLPQVILGEKSTPLVGIGR